MSADRSYHANLPSSMKYDRGINGGSMESRNEASKYLKLSDLPSEFLMM